MQSLAYVHYNLRLLSHYCDAAENDYSKRDVTWDNNLEETNLEDGAMVLERLEAELSSDHDGGHFLEQTCHPHPLARFQMH